MIWKWFGIVFLCCITGLLVGILVGLLMGVLAPDFAVSLLQPPAGVYSPTQLCIGLGIANGPTLGLVGGVGIVLADAVYRTRKSVESK